MTSASTSPPWRPLAALLRLWRRGGAGRSVLSVLIVAAAYFAAARIGLRLAYLDGAVTALWPPVGVGIAALVLGGPRLWPGVVLGDLLVADLSSPLGTVLGQTAGNTLEVVVAAVLLRRLAGDRVDLSRVSDVLALVGSAVVATPISAALGTTSLRLGGVISPSEHAEVLRTWWLSDLSGALIVAPAILTWAHVRSRRFTRRELLQAAALLIAIVLLADLPSQRDVPFVVFPALIFAALRFGPSGAATAVLITAALTVWNTAHNAGPFVRDSIDDSLLSTQLFLATAALTSLVLAAVTAERTRAASALLESERATRALAAEQTALRRIATLVAAEAPTRALFGQVTEEVGRLLGATSATLIRYDDDARARVVGGWTEHGETDFPVGSLLPLDGETVIVRVRRSEGPERIDTYDGADGALGAWLKRLGYSSSVAAPVRVGGGLWGVLVASARDPAALAQGAEQRLCDFAELIAQALANADARDMLAASRARLVAAGDAERRRLERNLHDGAQQRLVAVVLQLRLIAAQLDLGDESIRADLERAGAELGEALKELRELARGIHPAILTERGLAPAVAALADRSAVPVEIHAVPEERLPPAVEVAVYYVVAEAITNVAKYAAASHISVTIRHTADGTFVEVGDDGVGGADPAAGTGLRGIADRVEALGGRLDVTSPPGRGTRLTAHIPARARGRVPA